MERSFLVPKPLVIVVCFAFGAFIGATINVVRLVIDALS